MDALLNGSGYAEEYQYYGEAFPHRGYGGNFYEWIYAEKRRPYNSWGNGSAMRASPIGWYCNTIEDVLAEAKKSAEVTHNHPEGIAEMSSIILGPDLMIDVVIPFSEKFRK
jgi:ADP-ribosylglycohydrolase